MGTVLLGAVIILNIVILAVLLLKKNGSGAENVSDELNRIAQNCKDGFQEERRELNDNFSRSRLETAQSFNDFMKFLQDFRDAVRQADENTAGKLSESLLNYADRGEKKTAELTRMLDEKIRLFQEETSGQLARNRELINEQLKDIRN